MTASLNVTDYLETVLLLLGWIINNGIWDVINTTGLAYVPFIALIASEWFKARHEGDDEGNKGVLTVNRIEASMYAMIVCYAFTCFPLLDLSFNPVSTSARVDASGNECRVALIKGGEWRDGTLNAIGGQTADIPLWWAFVHAVSKGVTNAAIAKIPCTPDFQAIATEVDFQTIQDPALKLELSEFQRWCYGSARNMLFQQNGRIDNDLAADTDWLGSRFFQETPGYYDSFYAQRPIPGFPYDTQRDMSRPNTGPGQPGYPTCLQWWANGTNGLYQRLTEQVDPGFWDDFRSLFTSADAEDYVIRRMISHRAGAANGNQGAITTGNIDGFTNTDNAGDVLNAAGDTLSGVVGSVGGIAGVIFGKVGMDMVKQSLPMIQYVMVMAVSICLPFVMVMSGYSFKVAGIATFGLFALYFLTFWFELARWLNSNLIDMLYASEGAKLGWMSGITSVYDQSLLTFVNWAMYLIFPALWVGALGWAGANVGGMVATSLNAGGSEARSAGNKGSAIAEGQASKVRNKR